VGPGRLALQEPERGMIPIPCAGAGTYGGTMAHRRRSVIRFLLTAIALARTSTPVRC